MSATSDEILEDGYFEHLIKWAHLTRMIKDHGQEYDQYKESDEYKRRKGMYCLRAALEWLGY